MTEQQDSSGSSHCYLEVFHIWKNPILQNPTLVQEFKFPNRSGFTQFTLPTQQVQRIKVLSKYVQKES